ncbi:hypothetical protein ACN20G_10435 [Streptomyces sp. BI20]|uniref:hypothetical protein n=1 Tax=Streptomyces sp. BI20 TaxID=3403460 RepID=UPI003C7574D6
MEDSDGGSAGTGRAGEPLGRFGPGAVESRHEPRAGDVRAVLCRRTRRRRAGRIEFLFRAVAAPAVPATAVAALHPLPVVGPDSRLVPVLAAVGAAWALGFVTRSLVAARMRRWAAEYPEYRTVTHERGTVSIRPDGTGVGYPWSRYEGWGETHTLFVLVFDTGHLG